MGKTISTHNGSTANREHNIRNPRATGKQEHIDKSLKGQNEILHDEKPREAYKRIFGEALQKYNDKQTREDRRIRDYFSHIEKDNKKHTVYEMIVQIGDRNDTGINAPVERECLKEFYYGWKERNPHLECIGAYIHADETDGTVHMHIDYVPVATGYQRGMEVQNGLVKALEQQGFVKEGKATAQIQWEARENAALEGICERHGIEVVHPKGEKRQHMHTELYKTQEKLREAQKELTEARESLVTAEQEISTLQADKTALEGKIEVLEEQKGKVEEAIRTQIPKIKKYKAERDDIAETLPTLRQEKAKMNEELSDLEKQISDKESELEVVETAIKRKMDEGIGQFGMDGVQRLIAEAQREREVQDKLRKLERKVGLFERFLLSFPDVREKWEQFKNSIQKERTQKKDRNEHRFP